MSEVEVVEYVGDNGRCPFADWFANLDNQAAAKVVSAIERMKVGNLGDHKPVGEGVWERRIHFGPGYRFYFGRDGATLVILVGGGTKSRQSVDIAKAQATWAEYEATK